MDEADAQTAREIVDLTPDLDVQRFEQPRPESALPVRIGLHLTVASPATPRQCWRLRLIEATGAAELQAERQRRQKRCGRRRSRSKGCAAPYPKSEAQEPKPYTLLKHIRSRGFPLPRQASTSHPNP